MACDYLTTGFDALCVSPNGKYIQQAVLINYDDIGLINYGSNHNVDFYLKQNKTGYLFNSSDLGFLIEGSFSMSKENRIPKYDHTITIPITGIDFRTKNLIHQLDNSELVGVLKYSDGTIEVYGLGNTLVTENYTYTPQQPIYGATIDLVSKYPENNQPLVFSGLASRFDDLFKQTTPIPTEGDYNNDYNNDFLI